LIVSDAPAIGIDTNVLIRYLTRDEPAQAEAVGALFRETRARRAQVVISHVVLCEVIWVLERRYRRRKAELIRFLRDILADDLFRIDRGHLVQAALEDYVTGGAGFVDYLIGRLAHEAGAVTTYTFDREAAKAPTFKLLRKGSAA